METVHPEDGESPFVVKDDASIAALIAFDDEANDQYASCPVEGCGEALLLTELQNHIEMHEEEQDSGDDVSTGSSKKLKLEPEIEAAFDTKLSHALRNLEDVNERPASQSPSSDRQAAAKAAWKGLLKMPDSSSKAAQAASALKNPRRRLGVSPLPSTFLYHVILRLLHRNQSLALMLMRSRCQHGLSSSFKTRMERTRLVPGLTLMGT
jgi:hypothetical protein